MTPEEAEGDVDEEEDEDEDVDHEIKPVPISGEIDDKCRGDDKFRCGSTSIFICEIQKCDGEKNCPNGEDEENCPIETIDEGSGEEELTKEETSVEPEVAIPGDFFVLLFPKFFMIFLRIFIFSPFVDTFYFEVHSLSY